MNALLILFIFIPILVGILLALNLFLAPHNPDTEKVSPYECGYAPIFGQTRIPWQINYYVIAILFLVFDLEILLIYPMTTSLYFIDIYGLSIGLLFFAIITLGFGYELGKGVLKFIKEKNIN